MRFAPWLAAWFCAFISAITVISDLGQAFLNHQPASLGTVSYTHLTLPTILRV